MEGIIRTSNIKFSSSQIKWLSLATKILNMTLIIGLSLAITSVTVFAAGGENLTDLFTIEATRGSLKWLSKFNVLGLALNFIISAFCILVIFFIVFQKLITISYFVLREFWDEVDDVKKSAAGSGAFGLKGYWEGTIHSQKSSGLDALFNLLYIFLPNVKQMSEMGDRKSSKLTEDDTLVTWFMKTLAPTVFGILLLTMGFKGTLMQCYGMVVDGLGVVADEVATVQADAFIKDLMAQGEEYKFGFDISGTDLGEIQQNVASKMYKEVVYNNDFVTNEQRTVEVKSRIGASIESWVSANITLGNIQSYLQKSAGDSFTLKLEDLYGVKVAVSTSNSQINEGAVLSQPVGTFVDGTSKYVNIQFKLTTSRIGNYMQLGNPTAGE